MVQQLAEALRMLNTFASVGATHFDLTHTNIDGEKRGFRPKQSLAQLTNFLPKLFPGAVERQNNIIVRPHSETNTLIQLDDLDSEKLKRIGEVAFLTLKTSPGNHQAWVAISGLHTQPEAKDLASRLRKGIGADVNASGATRMSGTLNYKRQYSSHFPIVEIQSALLGHVVTPSRLIAAGLVAPEEAHRNISLTAARVSRRSEASIRARKWPDYKRCLENAPPNHGNTGPDTSRADFTWCMTALDWGFDVQETANKLLEISVKAEQNGPRYAELTARNAAAAVDSRSVRRGRA